MRSIPLVARKQPSNDPAQLPMWIMAVGSVGRAIVDIYKDPIGGPVMAMTLTISDETARELRTVYPDQPTSFAVRAAFVLLASLPANEREERFGELLRERATRRMGRPPRATAPETT